MDTVRCFKLLEINISDDLCWNAHVDALMCRSGVQIILLKNSETFWILTRRLVLYKSVIRSVVQYGCVVWHHNLTMHRAIVWRLSETCSMHYFARSYIAIQHCPRFR